MLAWKKNVVFISIGKANWRTTGHTLPSLKIRLDMIHSSLELILRTREKWAMMDWKRFVRNEAMIFALFFFHIEFDFTP